MSDNWCGGTVDVPIVGEGVVTGVAGGGCELDCGAFINIRGDIDGINGGARLVTVTWMVSVVLAPSLSMTVTVTL